MKDTAGIKNFWNEIYLCTGNLHRMDVVWMAKLQTPVLLKNKKGQSVVEYILLLAVLSSIGYSFYNNRAFKEFIRGDAGLFC